MIALVFLNNRVVALVEAPGSDTLETGLDATLWLNNGTCLRDN